MVHKKRDGEFAEIYKNAIGYNLETYILIFIQLASLAVTAFFVLDRYYVECHKFEEIVYIMDNVVSTFCFFEIYL